MKKITKRIAAMGAAMIMAASMMGMAVNAANYYLQYNRYSTSNITKLYIETGQATEAGKVTVRNNCTKLQYATKVTTSVEVHCIAPQGENYYSVTSIENESTGLKARTAAYPYIRVGNSIRNVVQLSYNTSSYYTQVAEGVTTSY